MPVGYLVTITFMVVCTLCSVAPPRWSRTVGSISFRFGFWFNELPFLVFYLFVASTALAILDNDVTSTGVWVAAGAGAVIVAGLAVIVARAFRARAALERALREAFGPEFTIPARPAVARTLFAPLHVRRHDVERIANIRYGDAAGRANLLDVYRPRSRPVDAPVFVHFHGGTFISGAKNREARPLIYRLAGEGWLCVSANYRLRPRFRFPDHLVDAKRVVGWVRAHAAEYGAAVDAPVFVSGSSAGGHLAAMLALTSHEPTFQPGFEDADTSVDAVVGLYGYYGALDDVAPGSPPSTPNAYDATGAPPMFVLHGDRDSIVLPANARELVEHVRKRSVNPVVYAELPGAQHGFDFFHSIRFDAAVDAIDAFTMLVRASR
jgi:acetyl esterase/lipase